MQAGPVLGFRMMSCGFRDSDPTHHLEDSSRGEQARASFVHAFCSSLLQ